MALINRVSRLLRADLHAVLDRVEEPEVLLRQAVREMDAALAEDRRRARLMTHEQTQLGARERDTLPLLARCFVDRGWMLAAAVVCDQASAVGVPDAELDTARTKAVNALGEPWRSFREQVPPPGRIQAPVYTPGS